MKLEYTRLYSDPDGESHFEDVAAELESVDFAPPAPPLKLSAFFAANQTAFFGAPAGWHADWHPASSRNLYVVISGEWEIEASDGAVRRFPANSVLLAEDTTGTGHKSAVISEEDSVALLVQLLT